MNVRQIFIIVSFGMNNTVKCKIENINTKEESEINSNSECGNVYVQDRYAYAYVYELSLL